MRTNGTGERSEGLLRTKILSAHGIEFDPQADVWDVRTLGGRLIFRFSEISGAHRALIPSLKATLAWVAAHRSFTYAHGAYSSLCAVFEAGRRLEGRPVREVTAASLINFRTDAPRNEYVLCGVASTLRRWHRLGYPGVSDDAIKYLKHTHLKGNPKGVAVATMDPIAGPLTDLELTATIDALTGAFALGEFDLSLYVATLLLILLGPRPYQLAAMKVCDLEIATRKDGTKEYALQVPRAKQRSNPRASTKLRPLPPQVGEVVERHVDEVRARLGRGVDDSSTLPMFPDPYGEGASEPGFEGHWDSARLRRAVSRALAGISPISERTGDPINLFAYRFRRTLATRALSEGHGLRIIAEILDHSDCQSVKVYAGLRPALYVRIKEKLAYDLAPLVEAFHGEPVRRIPGGARRITDPHADRSMRNPVGCCGSARACDFAAPVGCYTCRAFRPWIEGPHEAMLKRLLAEYERILAMSDEAMASTLTRAIIGAAQVVKACRALKRGGGSA